MKRLLLIMIAMVLALGLSLPVAPAVRASPDSMDVVSSNATQITKVYNKAGGTDNVVALSINAVEAYEPMQGPGGYPNGYTLDDTVVSLWDVNVQDDHDFSGAGADWIWETPHAEDPQSLVGARYDADASRWGRVVLFETTFDIPGNPTSATLHIAADNGWEAWVNSGTHYRSATVSGTGWENSRLYQADLNTSGWQNTGQPVIPAAELVNGTNTLYVLAGNEYFYNTPAGEGSGGTPPAYNADPYTQKNPGAVIFHLEIEYELVPEITINKTTDWTGYATIGDLITYYYDVENTGDTDLTGPGGTLTYDIVTDSLAGDYLTGPAYVGGDGEGAGSADGKLNPGEHWYYEATYEVQEEDIHHCQLHNIGTATAYYGEQEVTDDDEVYVDLAKIIILCAGRDEPVGTVTVVNNSGNLTVTYQTNAPWLMTEIHLQVSLDKDGDGIADGDEIPQTKKGNPIPGKFRENIEFCPPVDFWQVTYNLNEEGWVPCEDDLVIAAHAVVINNPGTACTPFLTNFSGANFLPCLTYKMMSRCGCIEEETAWAGGYCDTKPNVKFFVDNKWDYFNKYNKNPWANLYSGGNWATYFTYHVMLCDDNG